MNARGLTAQQQAQLDAAASTGRLPLQDRIKQEQALAQLNIGNQQKAFSDWIQTQQLATSQGQLSVSQANSALEYWKAAHPDAKVTMTGGEIVTPRPAQRAGDRAAHSGHATAGRYGGRGHRRQTGPKVANGTQRQRNRRNMPSQAKSYRQPTLRENPVTKETVRVNTRELPARLPGAASARRRSSGGPAGGRWSHNVVTPGLSTATAAGRARPGSVQGCRVAI